jgi:hypothetical protein
MKDKQETKPPRNTVGPLKVKPREGRPNKWDSEQEYELLVEFDRLWRRLYKIYFYEESLYLVKSETRPKFVQRITGVVQRLHLTTIYSLENSFVSGKDTKTSVPFEDVTMVQRPLGEHIALNIADRAVNRSGKRVSKNALLYGLLAFYHFNDPGKSESIRGTIERAVKKYPEDHEKIPSEPR